MTGTIIAIAVVLGLVPAFIARSKGQPFLVFWFLGALVFPVFLLVTLLMPSVRRCCPSCREIVQTDASVCPHCQRDIRPEAAVTA